MTICHLSRGYLVFLIDNSWAHLPISLLERLLSTLIAKNVVKLEVDMKHVVTVLVQQQETCDTLLYIV